jgi:hypothetical protein
MNPGNSFRNVVLFVAVVFVAAAFSACGGNRAGNVKAEEKEAAEEKITLLEHRYSKLVFQRIDGRFADLDGLPHGVARV